MYAADFANPSQSGSTPHPPPILTPAPAVAHCDPAMQRRPSPARTRPQVTDVQSLRNSRLLTVTMSNGPNGHVLWRSSPRLAFPSGAGLCRWQTFLPGILISNVVRSCSGQAFIAGPCYARRAIWSVEETRGGTEDQLFSGNVGTTTAACVAGDRVVAHHPDCRWIPSSRRRLAGGGRPMAGGASTFSTLRSAGVPDAALATAWRPPGELTTQDATVGDCWDDP